MSVLSYLPLQLFVGILLYMSYIYCAELLPLGSTSVSIDDESLKKIRLSRPLDFFDRKYNDIYVSCCRTFTISPLISYINMLALTVLATILKAILKLCQELNRTTSRENVFMPYANNKGADQPAHPRSLISAFVVRCLDSIIPVLAIAENSRP